MINKRYIILFTLGLILIFFSCQNTDDKLLKDQLRHIAERQNQMLSERFKSGDAEKLSQMYTDSAKLCPNGYDFVIGKENIKIFWADDFKTSKIIEMATHVISVDGNTDIIYETGISESKILIDDSLYHTKVKYINVWCKQADGRYLLDIDFWNKPGI